MLLKMVVANLKLIFRNRQSIIWALIVPLMFVTVFGVFRLDRPPAVDMLIVDQSKDVASKGIIQGLSSIERFHVYFRDDEAGAREEMHNGEAAFLVIIPPGLAESSARGPSGGPIKLTLLYDKANQTASMVVPTVQRFIDEANARMTGAPQLVALQAEGIQARHLTYFDFLLPGLVGMGVMNYAIIAVASVMAVYRENKVLKRMLATPLRISDYFAGVVIAHLVLSLIQAAIILVYGITVFNGHVYGNYGYVAILVLLGNLTFLNLGFVVGALSKTVSAASGLGNLVTLPLMFFSGVFFSKDTLPSVLRFVVDYLPLAPMLTAMRGVALEARPLWDFPTQLAILAAWAVLSGVLALRVFKFR